MRKSRWPVARSDADFEPSVTPKQDGLSGHLVLEHEVDDPRIGKVEPLTKRLLFHAWRHEPRHDLDETFGERLCTARGIRDGAHLHRK